MSDVESLISDKMSARTPSQKEIKMQLSFCLEQLHAKLDESRVLMKESTSSKNERRLKELDKELNKIKTEVMTLKEKLIKLNAEKAPDLQSCMRELDKISFKDFYCFTDEERKELEDIYAAFKDVTREGEDGAVLLMHLISRVKACEENKSDKDKAAVQNVEQRTLTRIFDIYSSLFPSENKGEDLTPPEPASKPMLSKPEPVPEPVLAGGSGGGLPTGGDGGSGDDSDSSFEPDGGGGNGGWFVLVMCVLLMAVAAVFFLPEDKTELNERLRVGEIQNWFKRVTQKVSDRFKDDKKEEKSDDTA